MMNQVKVCNEVLTWRLQVLHSHHEALVWKLNVMQKKGLVQL